MILTLAILSSVFIALAMLWSFFRFVGARMIDDRIELLAASACFVVYCLIASTIWLMYVRIPQ